MSITAMKQALEALCELEQDTFHPAKVFKHKPAITALRTAIAEAEKQEPVACRTLCELCVKRGYDFCANAAKTTPIITTPPAAQRQPLSLQERTKIVKANKMYHDKDEIDAYGVIDDVEAAHGIGEKNHGQR